jgi:hypothetical protein
MSKPSRSISTGPTPEVTVVVYGDLHVTGWDVPEVTAAGGDATLTAAAEGDGVRLECPGDCTLQVPREATVRIEAAHGDALVTHLGGRLDVGQVMGDLALQDVGPAHVEAVYGDLAVKRVTGDLRIDRVVGDASVRSVSGDLAVEHVGADLAVREAAGNLTVSAVADVAVTLEPVAGRAYRVRAGRDLRLRLPPDASARVHVEKGARAVRVGLPDVVPSHEDGRTTVTLGAGEAQIELAAGGQVVVAAIGAEAGSAAGIGAQVGHDIGVMADELAAQVEGQVGAMLALLNERLVELADTLPGKLREWGVDEDEIGRVTVRIQRAVERAGQRAQHQAEHAVRRAERRLATARRREARRAHRAEHHAGSRGAWSGRWVAVAPVPAPREPVTTQERLAVLRMLQEQRISAEQADQLLAALEGRPTGGGG